MGDGRHAPRVGLGFDVHPRTDERALWLGGILFEGEAGLAGHSDGDTVAHAVADGLLGAAALGDIGEHFPESDPSIEGIAGSELLARTVALVHEAGFRVRSSDVTVICERPAIGPRRAEMRARLAQDLGVAGGAVSVKATRPEGLALTGDGIGCIAIVVLA
jgi:2-C-methyl-D-erythritol 2,4-cyclodiphosphate synthase